MFCQKYKYILILWLFLAVDQLNDCNGPVKNLQPWKITQGCIQDFFRHGLETCQKVLFDTTSFLGPQNLTRKQHESRQIFCYNKNKKQCFAGIFEHIRYISSIMNSMQKYIDLKCCGCLPSIQFQYKLASSPAKQLNR